MQLEGGSGKAKIQNPSELTVNKGIYTLTLTWNSKNYDYIISDGIKYIAAINDGKSTFNIPIQDITKPLKIIADTVAMSVPHEIEYTLTFKVADAKN
ncbi:MAG: hypothetical protein K6G00_05150 [Treponema sp.]|nr:hypothetical protein [Treponema sp.]